MNMRRRDMLGATAAGVVLPGTATWAQAFPNKPIRIVVISAPGGLTDAVSRVLAPRLQALLGQPVVVDNKPGGSGGIGASAVAGSPADGHTYLVADGAMLTVNPLISSSLSYDVKDFVPVSLVGQAPLFLVVSSKLGVNSLDDLIKLAKAKPGRLNYGSSGVGSMHHLSMEALKAATGMFITHIPFRSTAASVPALLSGEIDLVFAAYPSMAGLVKAGQVRPLAVNSSRRWVQAPDIPSIAERFPGFDYAPNVIMLARAGTPADAIQRISADIAQVAQQPEAVESLRNQGVQLIGGSTATLAAVLQRETVQMRAAVRRTNLRAE